MKKKSISFFAVITGFILFSFSVIGCKKDKEDRRSEEPSYSESSLMHANMSLDALEALSKNDKDTAIRYLQIDTFVTISTLSQNLGNSSGFSAENEDIKKFGKSLLSYMEQNIKDVPSLKSPMTKRCIAGLEKVLDSEEDQRRIVALKDKLQPESKNQEADSSEVP